METDDTLKTRSYASSSYLPSSRSASSTNSAAVRARANAEAAKTRLKYAQREIEFRMEKARLEASIEMLTVEKEAAAAVAKAEALEAVAGASEGKSSSKFSLLAMPLDSVKRTSDYVEEQTKEYEGRQLVKQEESLLRDVVHEPHTEQKHLYVDPQNLNTRDPPAITNATSHSRNPPCDRNCGFSTHQHPTSHVVGAWPATPYSSTHAQPRADHHITDFVRYLARRELVTTGLLQFNDRPENYRAWRRSFQNAVKDLDLSHAEEMDLLVKWLGKESAEQAKRIRSIHINQPAKGLEMIWSRMDDCYGSPEAVETALFQKVDNFPKIGTKEYTKLRDLSDLLMELNAAKLDGDLPGLAYLDTARGVNSIVRKLPHGLQEKWLSYGSKYKQTEHVVFPPFSVFVTFLREQAQMRNDPSFNLDVQGEVNNPEKSPWRINRLKDISVHKTEVSAAACPEQRGPERSVVDPDKKCPIHKKPHSLRTCRAFREKHLEERKTFLRENGICFKCCTSTTHVAKDCHSSVKCKECESERHPTALHPGPAPWINRQTPFSSDGGERSVTPSPEITTHCTQVCGGDLTDRSCSKICLAKVYPKGDRNKAVRVYVILDEQSNRSLAHPEFFDRFNIQGPTTSYTLKTCSGMTEIMGRTTSGFCIESLDSKMMQPLPCLLECDEIPQNRAEIPTPNIALCHNHLKPIAPFIPELEPEVPIMFLLGRDVVRLHKVRQHINGPHDAPYAQRLDLGWVIMGNVCLGHAHKPLCVTTLFTNALQQDRPTSLQPCPSVCHVKEKYGPQLTVPFTGEGDGSLGHAVFQVTQDDNKQAPSIQDLTFMEIMKRSLEKDSSNSWVAPLPFKVPRQRLPDNKQQALKRFMALKRSLERKPEMSHQFFSFMEKLLENGHAEVAPALEKTQERWYLPIFGVYHPKKPGNIRVVFDSSAQYEGVSLNDVLLTGPDLNNLLIGVLIRFCREAIAVTADIKQMFYCFQVKKKDRDFLRFLWFRANDPAQDIIEYRMTVHVFGNSPSPAVAIYCLRQSVKDEGLFCDSEVKQFVERDFYVDDGLKSLPTVEDAISLLKRTQDTLANSNLRLHKIASNSREVMKAFPPEDHAGNLKDLDLGSEATPIQRSLGLGWNLDSDTFCFKVDEENKPFTRRGVLSVVNSIYDPLGFIAPVTVQGKCILRELTKTKCDWDTPLPAEMEEQWKAWRESLKALSDLQIPRNYTQISSVTAKRRELCVFSDASTRAIAAVVYLKITDENDNSHIGFVMGKTKLAPKPDHTVPRLELCSAVLAVELADFVSSELDLPIDATTFYTDSKVVLGYIHNETRRFYVFVANRVIRIRKSSHPKQWSYVCTDQNPADCATRSVSAANLSDTAWLSGPSFLTEPVRGSTEPNTFELVNPNTDVDIRPQVSTLKTQTATKHLGSLRFSKFSSWQSLRRAIAHLHHIARLYRNKHNVPNTGCHRWHICKTASTADQLRQAELIIIRTVQEEAYGEEFTCLRDNKKIGDHSPLRQLDPFIDPNGILRVGGRIKHGNFQEDEKHPVIIPGKHHVATLLVRHYHEETQHQGRHLTEGAVRTAGYWVIGVKRCVNSLLHHCVSCRKLRGSPITQKMADLPPDRLAMEPPFSNVGLDVFGPWSVVTRRTRGALANSKGWAVIFTCMAVRAVHIEVIESLDTSSFINALRRFQAIRGAVKSVRSDRGTNFVGASNELKIPSNIDLGSVSHYLAGKGCSWLFNPPHASHMGGSWERLIGIAKRILDAMFLKLGPSKLTHEVLVTLMAEVAAIINARPLIPVSADPSDPILLTPTTLLTQKVNIPTAPPVTFGVKDLFKQQWRQVQHLAQTFWSKWRQQYLSTLQLRKKWTTYQPNLEPGSVVLLQDPQLKRYEWPLGVVTQVFPSVDDHVRKVEVKVFRQDGIKLLLRPISDLILIAASDTDNPA